MAARDEFDDWDPVAERKADQAKADAAALKAKAPKAKAVLPPGMTKAQAARNKKAADAKSTSAKIGQATKRRTAWEQSPEGKARTRDIVDLATEDHNQMVAKHPHLFPNGPVDRIGMTHAQIYGALGVTNSGHGHGDRQLPGMENPHAAPQPDDWEDISPKKQEITRQNLRLQGTTPEKMKSDLGAQFDQSIWRAHKAGATVTREVTLPVGRAKAGEKSTSRTELRSEPTPFTSHFYGDHPDSAHHVDLPTGPQARGGHVTMRTETRYEPGAEPLDRPKAMMRESRAHLAAQDGALPGQVAADNHINPTVHTGAVGHVSPNVKFTQGERGARTSPNIEAAEAVFDQHEQGVSPRIMGSGVNRAGVKNQSRPANAVRAGMMLDHVARGNPMGTARNAPSKTHPEGSTQWGPKTGPFTNSFDEQHPDHLVADVHTGGGGMFPHLGTEKPLARDDKNNLKRVKEYKGDPRSDDEIMKAHGQTAFNREKSEREKAIEQTGTTVHTGHGKESFHALAHSVARQAVAERGLGTSVRRPQAGQWGEEQIDRKTKSPKLDVPSHEDAYPERSPVPTEAAKAYRLPPHVSSSQMKLFGG